MVDWYGTMCMRLRDYSDGDVWSDGEIILCKTKDGADAICDLLWQLYRSNDEEIAFTTGYFDPEEDARQGEEDRYTGWYYIDC